MKSFLTIIFCLIGATLFSKDKGIGLLYLSSDATGKVEVNIYEKEDVKSKILGSFFCQNTKEGQMGYKVQGKEVQDDNLIEFDYEKSGLPINKMSKGWVQVIYGFNKSGKALTGWVESKVGATAYFLWKDYLKDKMLFFESTDGINFYNVLNGAKAEFKLQPSKYLKYDYVMKALDQDGIWMRVQVTTPSDYCNTPKEKETKIFWIKYLDNKGRPLVWYFTRGC